MRTGFPPVRATPAPERIAPGSPAYQVLADPILYAYGLPGFLLPLFHPATAAATRHIDAVFTDPNADLFTFALRLRDTIEMIAAVALAADEADHVAYAMRELHRGVNGTDTRGAEYHAWTREIWTWNWSAIVSALMNAYATMRGFPDETFRDETYLGLVEVGRRFGVLGMPETYADFVTVWPRERDRIAHAENDTVQQVLRFIEPDGLPRPRGLGRLPAPLWGVASMPIRHVLRMSVTAGLDPEERALLGFTARSTDAAVLRAHRLLWAVALPRPIAHRAGAAWIRAHQRWGNPVWHTRFSAENLTRHQDRS